MLLFMIYTFTLSLFSQLLLLKINLYTHYLLFLQLKQDSYFIYLVNYLVFFVKYNPINLLLVF